MVVSLLFPRHPPDNTTRQIIYLNLFKQDEKFSTPFLLSAFLILQVDQHPTLLNVTLSPAKVRPYHNTNFN
jgi:hypothetical protein